MVLFYNIGPWTLPIRAEPYEIKCQKEILKTWKLESCLLKIGQKYFESLTNYDLTLMLYIRPTYIYNKLDFIHPSEAKLQNWNNKNMKIIKVFVERLAKTLCCFYKLWSYFDVITKAWLKSN
jgi:hypothetical protein